MSLVGEDERKSIYRAQGVGTEVVRLDKARASRGNTPPSTPRSSIRPTTHSQAPEISIPALREPNLRQNDAHSTAVPSLSQTLVDEITSLSPGNVVPVLSRLDRIFEHVEPVLVERFPGPLWVDPRRPYTETPRGYELSAIAACLIAMRTRAVPSVVTLLASPRADVRFFAAFVAREMPFAAVVEALGRLALHADPTSRLAAVSVLPLLSHAPGHPAVVTGMRLASQPGQPREIRVRAVQALEELRDAGAVPDLVSYLRDPDDEVADVARDALRAIAARTQGRFAWKRFLSKNAHRPRLLWLVDALTQWDADMRLVASIELARLTGSGRPLAPGHRLRDAKALVAHYTAYWSDISKRLGGTP